jgi:acetyl-CoA carboxylase beta subunit
LHSMDLPLLAGGSMGAVVGEKKIARGIDHAI